MDGRGYARIEQKNKFSVGETIEVMKPDGGNLAAVVSAIYDEDGNPQESAPMHGRWSMWIWGLRWRSTIFCGDVRVGKNNRKLEGD